MTATTDERLCLECGYDLRATPVERCPECGTVFDRRAGQPKTPWLRARRWPILTFWKTVALATFRPRRIADDIEQAAPLVAALRFRRRLSLWLAFGPMLALGLLYFDDVRVVQQRQLGQPSLLRGWLDANGSGLGSVLRGRWSMHWTWFLEAACGGIVLIMVWLAIHLALGVPSYFCHPRRLSHERQDRAIALSYFAQAPLAWLPLLVAIAFVIEWNTATHAAFYAWRFGTTNPPNNFGPAEFLSTPTSVVFVITLATLLSVVVLRTLTVTMTLVRRTTHTGMLRPIAAALTTLLAWPLLFLFMPAATCATLILLQLIFFSWTL